MFKSIPINPYLYPYPRLNLKTGDVPIPTISSLVNNLFPFSHSVLFYHPRFINTVRIFFLFNYTVCVSVPRTRTEYCLPEGSKLT